MKIGRNDLCWCNSGIKFKYCHLDRDKQKPFTDEDIDKELLSYRPKICLYPKGKEECCSSRIINAHTIQRNGVLNKISSSGHVLTVMPKNLFSLNKVPLKIGISKASIFPGFCDFHDNELFKPIENSNYIINDRIAFLFAYRALCKEIYEQVFRLNTIKFCRKLDRGKSVYEQREHQRIVSYLQQYFMDAHNDIQYEKIRYDKMLLSENYTDIRYIAIRIKRIPEFVGSGIIALAKDFDNNYLYSEVEYKSAKHIDHVTINITVQGNEGIIIFSWRKDELKTNLLIDSFCKIPNEKKPDAIARFIFQYCENLYISPIWWENLPPPKKEELMKRIKSGYPGDTYENSNSFFDDGIELVDWSINDIITKMDN